MAEAQPSATLMLLRDSGFGLQCLLLQRHSGLRFAPGCWVFPGGKVEAADQVDTTAATDPALQAARLAVVRETAEETGLQVAPAELRFFAHWTAPDHLPRRFATWFFFAESTADKVQVDGDEIEGFCWLSPAEALLRQRTGEMPMMPPTFVSLCDIERCATVAEVREQFASREPLYYYPRLVRAEASSDACDVMLYPGDSGWNSWDAQSRGRQHRLLINEGSWTYIRDE